jgi:ABC-type Zn uptake system ZnuABC Zn-binding protein ZnuA
VRAVLAALLALALLAGCGASDSGTGTEIVATTSQAADLARNVAGDRATVRALMAPNTDPHGYEVRPHDMRALADADLVLRSGGDVDEWLGAAIEGAGGDAPVLTLLDRIHKRDDDPHWWQDPRNAERAVGAIAAALEQADPDGAATYRANAERYTDEIRRLDAAAARCLDEIPPERRKLVTTHDALGYYAARYGLEVIGTVIPSLSTQGQASAGETVALVRTVRATGAPAIFAESSVNPKVEQAVADETGAALGAELWADTLGPPGSDGDTYLKSIAANTRAIAAGLTGGAARCEL